MFLQARNGLVGSEARLGLFGVLTLGAWGPEGLTAQEASSWFLRDGFRM